MKFKSAVLTQASGSIAGITYLKTSAGLAIQAKPRPVNTNSPRQRSARAVFSGLAITWKDTLNDTQREAWRNYAQLTPIKNRLGDTLALAGHQMFIRCNSTRTFSGLPTILDGPGIPGLATTGEILLTLVAINPFAAVTIDNTQPWANEIGGALNIFMSRILGKARNPYEAKKRFAVSILGNPSPPPNGHVIFTNPFGQPMIDAQTDQHTLFSVTAMRADGRVSEPNPNYGTWT